MDAPANSPSAEFACFGSPEVLSGEGTYEPRLSYVTPRPPRKTKDLPAQSSSSTDTPDKMFTNSPLNKQLTCVRESNRELKDRLSSAEDENMRLLSQMTLLEEEVKAAGKAEAELKARVRVLQMEKSELIQKASASADSPTKQKLHERVQLLKMDSVNKNDELHQLKREIQEAGDKMQALEKQVRIACEKLKVEERQVAILNQRIADEQDNHDAELRQYAAELDREKLETGKWRDIADEYQAAYELSQQLEREKRAVTSRLEDMQGMHAQEKESMELVRKELAKENEDVQAQNAALQTKVEELQSALADMEMSFSTSEQRLKQQLEHEQTHNAQTRLLVDELRHNLALAERKEDELRDRIRDNQAAFEEQITTLGEAQARDADSLHRRIQSLESDLAKQDAKHREKVAALKAEIKEMETQRHELMMEVAEQERERERSNESFCESVQSLREGLTTAEEEIQKLSQELSESQAACHQAQCAHKTIVGHIHQLQTKYDATLADLEAEREETRNLVTTLDELREDMTKLNETVVAKDAVEQQLRATVQQLQDEKQALGNVERQLAEATATGNIVRGRVSELEACVAALESEKRRLEKRVTDEESVLDEWERKWEEKSADLCELEVHSDRITDQLKDVREKREALQKKADNLAESLDQESNAREQIEKRLEETRQSFIDRLSKMTKDHDRDEQTWQTLEAEYSRRINDIQAEKDDVHVVLSQQIDLITQEKLEVEGKLELAYAELEHLRQLPPANEAHLRPLSALSIGRRVRHTSASSSQTTDSMSINTGLILQSNFVPTAGDDEDNMLYGSSVEPQKYEDRRDLEVPVPQPQEEQEMAAGLAPLNLIGCSTPVSIFKKPFTPGRPASTRVHSVPLHSLDGSYMEERHSFAAASGSSTLPRDNKQTDWNSRLSEINGQNHELLPHLRSSNPVETQDLNLSARDDDELKHGKFRYDEKMVAAIDRQDQLNDSSVLAARKSLSCMHVREKIKTSPAMSRIKRLMSGAMSPGGRSKSSKENSAPSTPRDPAPLNKPLSFDISPPLSKKAKKKLMKK